MSAAPSLTTLLELRYYDEDVLEVGEYRRAGLPVGARVIGPAIIREDLSTTFVCPQQTAEIGSFGEIVIEQAGTGGDRV